MKHTNILEQIILGADLSGEATPGQPIVEIVGQNRVIIENHNCVTAYSPNNIQVKVSFGYICISGNCLTLSIMTREKLVITGAICCITLQKGSGK